MNLKFWRKIQMADYNEMLSGALNRISNSVKEYTGGKSAKEIYEDGLNRAGNLGKAAKLAIELNSDTTELNRVFAEIGKLYYEENRANPGEFYKPLFSRLEELEKEISGKQAQMEGFKAAAKERASSKKESDISADIIDFNEATK